MQIHIVFTTLWRCCLPCFTGRASRCFGDTMWGSIKGAPHAMAASSSSRSSRGGPSLRFQSASKCVAAGSSPRRCRPRGRRRASPCARAVRRSCQHAHRSRASSSPSPGPRRHVSPEARALAATRSPPPSASTRLRPEACRAARNHQPHLIGRRFAAAARLLCCGGVALLTPMKPCPENVTTARTSNTERVTAMVLGSD